MNKTDEIKNFLIKARLVRSDHALDENESLIEGGIIDSLGLVELVGYIENNYGIIVGEDDLVPENFDTLAAIQLFISNHISSDNASAKV
jgi:acyl carrier protein